MERQKSENPAKPKWVVACAVILAIVVVIMCVALVRCPQLYTTKQHIRTITRLANKRYVKSGEYDSLTVYPLYDENDKVKYFLVELSPSDYVFVKPQIPTFYNANQYMRSDSLSWRRYRIGLDGNVPLPYDGKEWKADPEDTSGRAKDYRYETDEEGNFIEYTSSPYAVAGVLDQRLYLFAIDYSHYIPAIKQGEVFLNLISMEIFSYGKGLSVENISCFDIHYHSNKTL